MSTQTEARERPILFSGEMIRAILAGRKTMTRRLAKPPKKAVFLPDDVWKNDIDEPGTAYLDDESGRLRITCPHGQPGDWLWCKEIWRYHFFGRDGVNAPGVMWKADGNFGWDSRAKPITDETWRSSMFMPRWASRITLEITGVRVERLQQITEEDAIAEGMHEFKADGKSFGFGYDPKGTPGPMVCDTAIGAFALLWESINAKKAPWDSDPFVWAISFRRVKP